MKLIFMDKKPQMPVDFQKNVLLVPTPKKALVFAGIHELWFLSTDSVSALLQILLFCHKV